MHCYVLPKVSVQHESDRTWNLQEKQRTEKHSQLLFEFASVDMDPEVKYIPDPPTDKL